MQQSILSSMLDYASQGAMLQFGFEPVEATASGAIGWQGYSFDMTTASGKNGRLPRMRGAIKGWEKMTAGQKAMSFAPGVLGLGFTAYSVYQGGREGGISGAYDAYIWDLASNAGAARFAFGSQNHYGVLQAGKVGIKTAGTALKSGGMLKFGARYAGASIGAAIGQSIGGTPGAFIGGYFGAAPMAAVLSNPMLAAGSAAALTVGAVGYGSYHVLKAGAKAGYAHGRARHGIDTSGSMAAFMTQGAQTMRARAVSAIHKSHLNARSALGQEANFMHFPSRSYHSRYR